MRFVDSSYEIIEQSPGLIGVYKQIEKAARTSYKSEDRIIDGSEQKMVDALIKNRHYACLEHGTIYLKLTYDVSAVGSYRSSGIDKYVKNPYSRVIFDDGCDYRNAYITTNARVITENEWQDDLQYLCEPTEFHEKRITVKFVCSIGIGREILRHRRFSFMNESTRYCNYSKDKFNNELTYIIPQWIYKIQREQADYVRWPTGEKKEELMDYTGESLVHILSCEDRGVAAWVECLNRIEEDYIYLTTIDEHYLLKPEEARGILPLDLKSELIVTGFISDWKHFFELRSYIAATGKPHPDLQILADGLLLEFLDRDYITNKDIDELKDEKRKQNNQGD